jgi:hypothetical protein
MGPSIVNIFQYIAYKMHLYTVYLYLETALHVSGGTTTHHQERIQLYLQHLVFVTPLLLPASILEELELVWVCCGWQIPDALDTVVCAPDDGWWYHPKHVGQFPDINKLCNVASCWIYIGEYCVLVFRRRHNFIKYIDYFLCHFFKRSIQNKGPRAHSRLLETSQSGDPSLSPG